MTKPLKILLANNTLSLLAGSEIWSYTLAIQLKKLGHKVQCFSPDLGIISEELDKENISSFNQISTSGVRPFSFVCETKRGFVSRARTDWRFTLAVASVANLRFSI